VVYRKTGVLLLAFGGPEASDDIAPFMERLMGRAPGPELIEHVASRYRTIGGGSPLPEITRRQAQALENDLGSDDFKVYVGLQYSHPLIPETVDEMAAHGIERAVALSMSPHSSRVSSAAYIETVRRATAKAPNAPAFLFVEDWHTEPLYLDAVAEKIRAALGREVGGERAEAELSAGEVEIIFSAHSLPVSYIEDGDPYVEQLNETVAGVLERLGEVSWQVAYQSKGRGEGEWLGPTVTEVMSELAASRKRRVLIVPIGFVSDHVETLYDIDIVMKREAEAAGLSFARAESLNTSPTFIDALAHVVRERLRNE
jgi:ferrochelatase